MCVETTIINEFSNYSSWLNTLEDMEETLWSKPIAKGKWSVSEIIAHIINWDNHLISEVIPAVQSGKGMEFPDFNTHNKTASNYAKSGISKSKLLEEAKNTRKRLVKELNELPNELLNKSITSNGVTHCPHTGTPYSLIYIVKEFIDHDHHHKGQIIQFLKKKTID
ncbi:DinB family protein [Rummeliibacillus sp. TYF005]|uniref:DinB family protein n=1 Tax=Rummeliibacillus sp. TYF005 TaxID=2058214 RepID=UPI000F52B5E6|nr:DinB family protein [Rummeliibacillus sp. TYF005]RPJ94399.1 DinB family protein [Rummeliibacillus sp. TYF005]